MSYSDFILDVFKSERLVYRAMEDTDEDKAWISEHLQNDPASMILSTSRIPIPLPVSEAQDILDFRKKSVLSVFRLPQLPRTKATSSKQSKSKPTPIGQLNLFHSWASDTPGYHRNAMIGINIAAPYRKQGYGTEAINWVLDWGFRRGGLHRISIAAWSFNTTAVTLYRKLGFADEGVEREAMFFDRKWYDAIHFGMLESEWAKLRGLRAERSGRPQPVDQMRSNESLKSQEISDLRGWRLAGSCRVLASDFIAV